MNLSVSPQLQPLARRTASVGRRTGAKAGRQEKVSDSLVEALRAQEAFVQTEPERLFKPGERVRLTETPFAGIEGIYQMADGERRAMVLIEWLSRQVRVPVAPASLRKVG